MTKKVFYVDSDFSTKSLEDTKGLRIAGYANTVSKDRGGDIVLPEAWANGVDNFRRNPILLFQHDQTAPIGRVDKLRVDSKGLYVEATVSQAAEKSRNIISLINDGVLKSFSVGFGVKKARNDRKTDALVISEVELLELSIVSVPMNQDSLFRVQKSFDSNAEYKSFISEIIERDEEETEIMTAELEVDTKALEEGIQEIETKAVDIQEEVDTDTVEVETKSIVEDENEEDSDSILTTVEEPELATLEVSKNVNDVIEPESHDSIPLVNLLSADITTLQHNDLVSFENKMFRIVKIATAQSPIFKFLEIDDSGKDSDNIVNMDVNSIKNLQNEENEIDSEDSEITIDELPTNSTKENDPMSGDNEINEVISVEEIKATTGVNSVKEPEAMKLVEKTGEAIKAAVAVEEKEGYHFKEEEKVKELLAQLRKEKEQVSAMLNSKMAYQESTRSGAQFSEKEMADAVFLSGLMRKSSAYDTKYGLRMKAVTSDASLLTTFSRNMYEEMEQKLIIAPMFKRVAVTSKNFDVPVSDEETDGYVAMFPSGTYATGIADATNVPTSVQHSISTVALTPHKFMATTHIAKDEEEDNLLPLVGFLRDAMAHRLARAIDKSILRGTGAISSFNAGATAAITAGTGFPSVIEGITNLTGDASLTVSTGSSTDKPDPSDIAAARAAMGKYGLQIGNDLIYVTSIEGYNNLITTSDFRTVDKFGPQATYLTGHVGAVYGIPVVVSEFMDGVGTTGNHLGTLVYKPGFIIGERRAVEMESQYEPRQQVTAMYISTRFDFKALTTNASAALDATKYAYATTVLAG